jgi:hypothetical protein
MFKGLLVLTVAMTIPATAIAATKSTALTPRGYEECHALAVSRGVRPGKRAERYTMLKGFDHKTNPQGLIARCMAGHQI